MRFRVGAILVAILALGVSPTFAQSVTGGVKIGANFSSISFSDDETDDFLGTRTGLAVGAFVDVPFSDLFSVQPEFLYSQKGAKGDLSDLDPLLDGDAEINLDQIQIPVLFKANFAGGSYRPFVVVGPGFGFTTSAKSDDPFDGEVDIKDDVESVEYSAIFGAGVQFGRGTVEFRYDLGLNDLDKGDDSDDEAKTRTWSILFGFRFGG